MLFCTVYSVQNSKQQIQNLHLIPSLVKLYSSYPFKTVVQKLYHLIEKRLNYDSCITMKNQRNIQPTSTFFLRPECCDYTGKKCACQGRNFSAPKVRTFFKDRSLSEKGMDFCQGNCGSILKHDPVGENFPLKLPPLVTKSAPHVLDLKFSD
jgi:hypothetical protein